MNGFDDQHIEITSSYGPVRRTAYAELKTAPPGGAFAVIADIHANYPNLKRCLERIRKEGVDTVFCLGDIVGYGDAPGDCVRAVLDSVDPEHLVLGNHDVALCRMVRGWHNPEYEEMSDLARFFIEEHARKVDPDDMDQLLAVMDRGASFLVAGDMRFAHGLPVKLRKFSLWSYLSIDPGRVERDRCTALAVPEYERMWYSAREVLPHVAQRISFVGHTHRFQRCKHQGRWLVNVGSIGRPRDEEASFVIMDGRRLRYVGMP